MMNLSSKSTGQLLSALSGNVDLSPYEGQDLAQALHKVEQERRRLDPGGLARNLGQEKEQAYQEVARAEGLIRMELMSRGLNSEGQKMSGPSGPEGQPVVSIGRPENA